mmetsp:Transcript_15850/g.22665  ORF Transcript_15850/g.22665 Transcript_15850/m.22665 type:complete len:326 (-) Transcript_15850:135-1112(-)
MFKKPPRKKIKGTSYLTKNETNNDNSDGEEQGKNSKVARRRRTNDSDSEEEEEVNTSALLAQLKAASRKKANSEVASDEIVLRKKKSVRHEFQSDSAGPMSAQELAVREGEYHPTPKAENNTTTTSISDNGDTTIKTYRGQNQQPNKFLAGPLRAPTFVRTTCRFDYQPDICKDYKETGFCGFGDTCIYLHDRGDTLTGWQLEKKWEEQRKKENERKEQIMNRFMDGETTVEVDEPDDGIPFACYICRDPFSNPVVTSCGHYFCSKCIMDTFNSNSPCCPVCSVDTVGVFNHPSKLYAKKRRVGGNEMSWKDYANAMQTKVVDTS